MARDEFYSFLYRTRRKIHVAAICNASAALKHAFQPHMHDATILLPQTFLFLRPPSPSSRTAAC